MARVGLVATLEIRSRMYETPYTNDRHGSVALFLLDTEARALNKFDARIEPESFQVHVGETGYVFYTLCSGSSLSSMPEEAHKNRSVILNASVSCFVFLVLDN